MTDIGNSQVVVIDSRALRSAPAGVDQWSVVFFSFYTLIYHGPQNSKTKQEIFSEQLTNPHITRLEGCIPIKFNVGRVQFLPIPVEVKKAYPNSGAFRIMQDLVVQVDLLAVEEKLNLMSTAYQKAAIKAQDAQNWQAITQGFLNMYFEQLRRLSDKYCAYPSDCYELIYKTLVLAQLENVSFFNDHVIITKERLDNICENLEPEVGQRYASASRAIDMKSSLMQSVAHCQKSAGLFKI